MARTTCCAKPPHYGPMFPCDDCPAEIDPEFKPLPRDDYDRAEREYNRMEEDPPNPHERWME